MTRVELLARTKAFALNVVRLCSGLSRGPVFDVIERQLLRSATSVGANYRSACRARSRADFVAKLALVEEEGDESLYWLELLSELPAPGRVQVAALRGEAEELVSIFTAARKTARRGVEVCSGQS